MPNILELRASNRLLATAFAILIALCGACAQERNDDQADFWEKYDDTADWLSLRLKLTPEQEHKVLPILQQNFQQKKAMLQKYGFEIGKPWPKISVEQRQEIDAKMIAIRAETRAKLVSLLNPDQLEELKKIQREYHEEFRKQLAEE